MEYKGRRIIEAGHVTEVYGNVQALRNYLAGEGADFIYITHPFSYTAIEGTSARFYESGREARAVKGHKRSANQIWQWIADILFNIFFVLGLKGKAELFIGVDNLNAFTGIVLKFLGKSKRSVYYLIEHMDRRFKNPVFNFLYEAVDAFACRHSDFVWSLTPRITEAKSKKYRINPEKFLNVPMGIELDSVAPFTKEEKLRSLTMVAMAYLDETKGIQTLISAMPEILKSAPGAKLVIIGTGPYENNLKELSASLGLGESVRFAGLMNHAELFNYIPKQRIGLAPYSDDKNSYTWYSDPTKPKEYIGCGLPLVITRVPAIAGDVEKAPMGIACAYNKEEIAAACVKLLIDDQFYLKCLEKCLEYSKGFGWKAIYDKAFKETGL